MPFISVYLKHSIYISCFTDAVLSVAYNPVEAKRDQFATTGVDGVVKFWNFSAAGDSDASEGQTHATNGDMMMI